MDMVAAVASKNARLMPRSCTAARANKGHVTTNHRASNVDGSSLASGRHRADVCCGHVGVAALRAEHEAAAVVDMIGAQAALYDHAVVATSANTRASSIPATSVEDAQAAFGRYWTIYLVLHHATKLVTAIGSITVLSGSSGRRPVAGYGVWSALHGGIEVLAKAAALELSPIRVNVLSPGGIGLRPDAMAERSGPSARP